MGILSGSSGSEPPNDPIIFTKVGAKGGRSARGSHDLRPVRAIADRVLSFPTEAEGVSTPCPRPVSVPAVATTRWPLSRHTASLRPIAGVAGRWGASDI